MIESTYSESCGVRLDKLATSHFFEPNPSHEHQPLNGVNDICIHCYARVQPTDRGPRTIHLIREWP